MTEQAAPTVDFVALMAALVDTYGELVVTEESLAKEYVNKALRIEPGLEDNTYRITLVDESVVEGEVLDAGND